MSKYVRGVKRNQIIQRWIQGIDDPDYEVFPTKKEGKYIVKLREKSEPENGSLENEPEIEPPTENGSRGIPLHQISPENEPPAEISPENEPPAAAKPRSRSTVPRDSTIRNSEVRGINLEILEQLRNLGEELRNDRFKKEQKQYIKHVVNKELSKSRIRSRYVPDMFPENEPEPEQPEPVCQANLAPLEPVNEQPLFRSRIRR